MPTQQNIQEHHGDTDDSKDVEGTRAWMLVVRTTQEQLSRTKQEARVEILRKRDNTDDRIDTGGSVKQDARNEKTFKAKDKI